MSLTLVTGPANAEKARVVLDGYRAARGRGALLVVPTFGDVQHYRHELARSGAVFGAEVLRFALLEREVARRAGLRGRPLGALGCERVAAAAVAATPLRVLTRAATTPGFPRALTRFAAELEAERVSPARLRQALRAWAAGNAGRAAYGEELGALYGAYRDRLAALGRSDRPLHLTTALDVLRTEPGRWGGTPVLLYGFDDLDPLQRDTVETLAATGAEVTASLTYEAGRFAFAGRAATVAALLPVADRHIALEARAEHYAPAARAALHHLERRLFEPSAADEGRLFRVDALDGEGAAPAGGPGGGVGDEAPDPGAAITLLEGGGEREELELVAAEVARLVREGQVAPEEIAVVLRSPRAAAGVVRQVFEGFGIPVALDRRVAFGHTALGGGLVALLRCALLDGTAAELLAWLRTPGLLEVPALADGLEAQARREGAHSAAEARVLWERDHWPLDAIDRVRAAAGRGPAALLGRLDEELTARFGAPWRRQAPVLTPAEALDAQVLSAGRRALGDLAELAAADPGLAPAPLALAELLVAVEVPLDPPARAGAVLVTSPLALRARRVRALFVCGLQERVFPAAPPVEPFLGDAERAELASVSGLVLRRPPDALGAERYLFYAAVSRPAERLYLSWRTAEDDGDPAVRSLFVDDVADLFGDRLWRERRRRPLGAVGWPAGTAPTAREHRRGEVAAQPPRIEAPAAPLSDPAVLEPLRARTTWSASEIEAWAGCPVKWFVERRLKLGELEPDPEPMVRGQAAHQVLEDVLRALEERHGRARLDADTLAEARTVARDALARQVERRPISPDPRRARAQARRLEADLERYLEHAAACPTPLVPQHLELGFGREGDPLAALDLGAGVALAGRIDRIDVGPGGKALVYDYKGRSAQGADKWLPDRRYQAALYVLATRDLLGLDPVGALYQPVGATDQRARGLLRDDADESIRSVNGDRRPPAEFEAVVQQVADAARTAVAELRSGALESRPPSCAFRGGCSFPALCRWEGA